MTAPIALEPHEGHTPSAFGTTYRLLATAADTGGSYSLIEIALQPGGFGPAPHVHREEDESFYVLEGELDLRVGDVSVRGTPGAFVFVPRGTAHSFANVGSTIGRLLAAHLPALDGFFTDLAQLAEGAAQPDKDAISAVMATWGMDVVGP